MEEIIKACRICKGTVKGDEKNKYYCKKCNILFNKKELISEKKENE